jgi:4'-phosphopantetheinyl transferase EntD
VGLDFEAMREVPENGWRFFLTPDERAWLADAPLGFRSEIVVWALKEAGYKALKGAVSGVLKLTVAEADKGQAAIVHPEGRMAARWVRSDEACLAVAMGEGDRGLLAGLAMPSL